MLFTREGRWKKKSKLPKSGRKNKFFLFFHFYYPVLGTGGGKKNIQRQPPVPSSANYWYISKRCSCKQLKFTVPKQRVPIQQTQKGASRYLGKRKKRQGIRSKKKMIRKDSEQWKGHHSHSSPKDAHQLPWDRNFKISYNMRQEPKWLKGKAISLFNSCKEDWNKRCQNQGILSHKHKPKPLSSPKHSPCILSHPPFPRTTSYHHHTQTLPTKTPTHTDKTDNKQETFPLHASRITKWIKNNKIKLYLKKINPGKLDDDQPYYKLRSKENFLKCLEILPLFSAILYSVLTLTFTKFL